MGEDGRARTRRLRDDPLNQRRRILIASPQPLVATAGAAQTASELIGALRDLGHEVSAWVPPRPPASLPGRRHAAWRSRRLQQDLEGAAFDWIDVPPVFASKLAPGRRVVVRSVQPDWLYYREDLIQSLRRAEIRRLAQLLMGLPDQARAARGLSRGDVILCLGSLELAWLRRTRPRLGRRACAYLIAPPTADRAAIRQERSHRKPKPIDETRWLWLGRWTAHKGIETLLAWARTRLRQFPQERLTLAGTGRDLSESDLVGLPRNQVSIIPAYSREELPRLLGGHDAGLFTSAIEGWGISLNEMLESGLPVFATNAGAVPDLAPHFPRQLLRFPPDSASQATFSNGPLDSLESYDAVFDWPHIASRYLSQVEGLLR